MIGLESSLDNILSQWGLWIVGLSALSMLIMWWVGKSIAKTLVSEGIKLFILVLVVSFLLAFIPNLDFDNEEKEENGNGPPGTEEDGGPNGGGTNGPKTTLRVRRRGTHYELSVEKGEASGSSSRPVTLDNTPDCRREIYRMISEVTKSQSLELDVPEEMSTVGETALKDILERRGYTVAIKD